MNNTPNFGNVDLFAINNGKEFEDVVCTTLPPYLMDELDGLEEVIDCRGTAMDQAGVDLDLVGIAGGFADVCIDARDKVIRIALHLAHKMSDRCKTECVLTRGLLVNYQSEEIDAEELVSRGCALWDNLLAFACEHRPLLLMCCDPETERIYPEMRAQIKFPFPTD